MTLYFAEYMHAGGSLQAKQRTLYAVFYVSVEGDELQDSICILVALYALPMSGFNKKYM